jgi:hypothetical protein
MIGILVAAFLPPLIIAVVLVLERVEESLGATPVRGGRRPTRAHPAISDPRHPRRTDGTLDAAPTREF